eukprot:6295223-Ditylum_brightwellii.AAC.1
MLLFPGSEKKKGGTLGTTLRCCRSGPVDVGDSAGFAVAVTEHVVTAEHAEIVVMEKKRET